MDATKPPVRKMRRFPLTFIITKPTKTQPGSGRGYDPQELAEFRAAEETRKAISLGLDVPAATAIGEPPNEPPPEPASSLESAPVPQENSDIAVPSSPGSLGDRSLPVGRHGFSSDASASSSSGVSTPEVSDPPDLARHARKCRVCSHPNRDVIEGDFIRWRSPDQIAREHQLPDRVSIYRHAHATGLFKRRKRNLGRVLENILESVDHTGFEAAEVIVRAARIYAHLDDEGCWFEPVRVNYLLTGPASLSRQSVGLQAAAFAEPEPAAASESSLPPAEAQNAKVEPRPDEPQSPNAELQPDEPQRPNAEPRRAEARSAKPELRPWRAEARSAKAANRNCPELEIELTP